MPGVPALLLQGTLWPSYISIAFGFANFIWKLFQAIFAFLCIIWTGCNLSWALWMLILQQFWGFWGQTGLLDGLIWQYIHTGHRILECLQEINSWMKSSWLKLNTGKTKAMLVRRGECFEEWAKALSPPSIHWRHTASIYQSCAKPLGLAQLWRKGSIAFWRFHS